MLKRITVPVLLLIITILIINIFPKDNNITTKKVVSNNANLRISIDGVSSENLPSSGNYYLTKYKCLSNNTKVSWDRKTLKLNITNKSRKANISCNLSFKSTPFLNEMKEGSYVKYQGTGGNVGSQHIACKYNGSPSSNIETDNTESPNSCVGENAREDIDKDTYGYCYSSNYKFYTKGWRIAYIKKEKNSSKAIIISAASPECIDSNNTSILNTKALKYCNNEYVDNDCNCNDNNNDGICDETPNDAWNINDNDFSKIVSISSQNQDINGFNINNCFNNKSTISCGYNNDLIDNGGYYWFSTTDNAFWNPDSRTIFTGNKKSYGLRPIIKLSSSVIVLDGDGTEENPYIVGNNNFTINNGDTYTNKKEVVLNIISGNADKMCISNTSKCENYVKFSNKVNWQLTDKDGTKNIYIYLKDNKNRTIANLHQRIILDTMGPTNNKLEISDNTANKITININSNGAKTMCISESDDYKKCNWLSYQKEYEYTLNDINELKTIYAFFQDKEGNISKKSLTYNCETCNNAFTVSYNFDGSKSISNINEEKFLNIITSYEYPWTIDSTNKYLSSNNRGIDKTSSITSINIKPTTNAKLSFDYGVSSELNYDKLTIIIKNKDNTDTLVNAISGTKEDKITNYNLAKDEEYNLILNYTKDSKGSSGKDIGYIKNIIIK